MESCEIKKGERQSAFGSESGQERGELLRLLPGLSSSATACNSSPPAVIEILIPGSSVDLSITPREAHPCAPDNIKSELSGARTFSKLRSSHKPALPIHQAHMSIA